MSDVKPQLLNRGRSRRSLLVLVAALALVVAACQSDTGTSTTAAEGTTTTAGSEITTTTSGAGTTTSAPSAEGPTLDELIAASQAEGGDVTLYLPGSTDMAEAVDAAFGAAYPWTNIEVQSVNFSDMPNKLITEAVTGSATADVFMLPGQFRQTWMENDVVAATPLLPSEAGVPQDMVDPDGFSHPVYIIVVTTLYNTNSMPDGPPLPEDMVDPQWSGQIAFDRVQNNGQSTLWLSSFRSRLGDDAWMAWLDGLEANDIFITGSGGDTYGAVLRGEVPFGIAATNDVLQQEEGTPVAADFSSAPVPFIQNLWLTSGAGHPATGTLLINWLLSEEGQVALAGTGRTPVVPGIDSPVSLENILPSGVQLVPATDLFDYYANASDYIDILGERWPG